MKGNTLVEFIDDLLAVGGPEKEFVFRDKYYFLETLYSKKNDCLEMYIDEYDNSNLKSPVFQKKYIFSGDDYTQCVRKFETAAIFDGMNIYEAESEIEVLFG